VGAILCNSPAPVTGTLSVNGEWGASQSSSISLPAGASNATITLMATADKIKLWWPLGLGAGQPLYNVTASFQASSSPMTTASLLSSPVLKTHRRIGFRYFALVTGNDTDAAWVAANKDADGNADMGHRWRINGAPIFSRGANMIPMDELEGRYSSIGHQRLVQSAADAGMNTLRLWGGGIFQPDIFYDTCDQLGIMVYHDMMYAQEGHSPKVTTLQEREFRHQIRRLSHHPSIVIWDGCNECTVILGTDTGIYASFVLTTVVSEDMSRVVWPSCPAYGWSSGVNRLDSLPNGRPLVPKDPRTGTVATIETHGPYQHGAGFPAVNGQESMDLFPSNLPIPFVITNKTGLTFANVFVSEFGSSVMSSFESTQPTLSPDHWGLHGGMPPDKCTGQWDRVCTGGNPMAQRNYPCDNLIFVYFGAQDFNATHTLAFQKQLWQCMMAQSLVMKTTIEKMRTENHFGLVIWQLGEVWPTGGWGSIEYGSHPGIQGQVTGGRWKPLHYWLKRYLFKDEMISCGTWNQQKGLACVVKNDAFTPLSGTVIIESVELATGNRFTLINEVMHLAAGPGSYPSLVVVACFDICCLYDCSPS
jgi:beta-mannosidase